MSASLVTGHPSQPRVQGNRVRFRPDGSVGTSAVLIESGYAANVGLIDEATVFLKPNGGAMGGDGGGGATPATGILPKSAQSVPWAMILWGLDLIIPTSCQAQSVERRPASRHPESGQLVSIPTAIGPAIGLSFVAASRQDLRLLELAA
jgi:hypothetical protein